MNKAAFGIFICTEGLNTIFDRIFGRIMGVKSAEPFVGHLFTLASQYEKNIYSECPSTYKMIEGEDT